MNMTRPARYLYVTIAGGFSILVFGGFTRTYWAPLATGTDAQLPAIHVHAILFFAWMALFLVQTILPLRNRVAAHRALGLAGIALAAMMVFSGVLAAIVSLKAGIDGPRPQAARTAAVLSFGAMLLFSTFVVVGIANLRRPAWHKRFMLLAMFSILQAAVARWIMLIPAIGQPTRILIGAVVVDVMLLAAAFVDARAEGRLHPAWLLGGGLIVGVQYVRAAILPTAGWLAFTNWLVQL